MDSIERQSQTQPVVDNLDQPMKQRKAGPKSDANVTEGPIRSWQVNWQWLAEVGGAGEMEA